MIQHCTRCLMPSSRPRIVFEDGVCNACHYHAAKKEIDWDARRAEFVDVVDGARRGNDGRSPYDCVVPFSGGKDSAAIAWRLKHEHGLNPLLVCYGQLLWTDVGRQNLHAVADAGFDILYWRVNQAVSRKLARRFMIERGHPKQHYDAGVNAVPLITAVRFGIPLVFYAEHGESEYGGLVLDDESRRSRNLTEVLENQVGDDPRNWAVGGISEREIAPYVYPEHAEIERVGVKAFYYSYFFPWSIHENALFTREKMDFRHVEPRSDGSFEGWDSIDDKIDGLDFWMMGIKFGFARATRMASRLIQSDVITREQGLEYVRKYDHEFPEMYLDGVLEYLDMSRPELIEVADKHRNPEIWRKDGHIWTLRHQPK